MDVEAWKAAVGDSLILKEPLAKHTTFGIGGPADYFLVAGTRPELCEWVRLACRHAIPYFILGGGANLLVSDEGIRGLVIHNQCQAVEFAPDNQDMPLGEVVSGSCEARGVHNGAISNQRGGRWLVNAESGAELRSVAREAAGRGLAGLEWAVDVPGTVGGAVVGNAGAYGGYIADTLLGVCVFSFEEGERWLPSADLGFDYRTSMFKTNRKGAGFGPVILSATFALRLEDTAALQGRLAEYSKRRAESQPKGLSAGSVFKRTAQYPAGFLIENAGLKETRVGGAMVSSQHANFIINLGTATARDVYELIELIQTTVHTKFKIVLELEIELVGDW